MPGDRQRHGAQGQLGDVEHGAPAHGGTLHPELHDEGRTGPEPPLGLGAAGADLDQTRMPPGLRCPDLAQRREHAQEQLGQQRALEARHREHRNFGSGAPVRWAASAEAILGSSSSIASAPGPPSATTQKSDPCPSARGDHRRVSHPGGELDLGAQRGRQDASGSGPERVELGQQRGTSGEQKTCAPHLPGGEPGEGQRVLGAESARIGCPGTARHGPGM
jgi:hypothetical protein